jgi:hypothetical protein
MKQLVALIGSFGAAFLSYTVSKSVGWALLHFFLSWLYVLYYFLMYFLPSGGQMPHL